MTTYRQGADTDALARIARTIRTLQTELTGIEASSRAAMSTIQGNWGGETLLSLVRDFTATAIPGLQACTGVLEAMSTRLEQNVRAQLTASGQGGNGIPGSSGGDGMPAGSSGPGGESRPNLVTRTGGKKHALNPFSDYTHGWKDSEHGEHEHSSVGGYEKDSHTRTLRDSERDLFPAERDAASNHHGREGVVAGDGLGGQRHRPRVQPQGRG